MTVKERVGEKVMGDGGSQMCGKSELRAIHIESYRSVCHARYLLVRSVAGASRLQREPLPLIWILGSRIWGGLASRSTTLNGLV